MDKLSIIVPVLNEQESIKIFFETVENVRIDNEMNIDWNKLNNYNIFDILKHSKILTKTAKKKTVK